MNISHQRLSVALMYREPRPVRVVLVRDPKRRRVAVRMRSLEVGPVRMRSLEVGVRYSRRKRSFMSVCSANINHLTGPAAIQAAATRQRAGTAVPAFALVRPIAWRLPVAEQRSILIGALGNRLAGFSDFCDTPIKGIFGVSRAL